ncbi:MAG: DUF6067 family protein [Kiritimatiellae bacterium]|nr:DUF6067 family protein [Kiritimatiellia bacterium]
MKKWLCGLSLIGVTFSCAALDSSDLLFQLSFENGLAPELARGSAAPVTLPTNMTERLVEGLFGKGYRFGGQGSGVAYATGHEAGGAACDEMYAAPANFFGDFGTVAFWIKQLPVYKQRPTHNTGCCLFLCNGPGIFQIMKDYSVLSHHYAGTGSGMTDGLAEKEYQNEWLHVAVTFQKGRTQSFMNGGGGLPCAAGVLEPTPKTFLIASPTTDPIQDNAVMDEVQIFRRPLSEEEVISLFERGHVTVLQPVGYGGTIEPRRAFAPAVLTAPRPPAPIAVDGNLAEWQSLPAHGGLVERRVGVLDADDARFWIAADDRNLYLAFRTEVDKELQADPTHVKYPTGQYKALTTARDGDVDADDYVEWSLQSAGGQTYRFAINARDALLDSRDGDKSWNGNVQFKSRSDFADWTAELAIPLADVGMRAGETVAFNATRSWKLFKSAQNSLCIDARSQPAMGKLTLGAPAAVSVSALGAPDKGDIRVTGAIVGPAGAYTVRLIGSGRNQGFTNEQKVAVNRAPAVFEIAWRMKRPGDVGLVVETLDPTGQCVFRRAIPVVYARASSMELANYPGWGKLDVKVRPAWAPDMAKLRAEVTLERAGKPVQTQTIARFDGAEEKARFETREIAIGQYEVAARIFRDKTLAGENRLPFEKKPLPEWFHSKAGMTDKPPAPWTDVKVRQRGSQVSEGVQGSGVRGQGETVVECLLKEIAFRDTLFPAEILSNGEMLLARPVGLRVKRGGRETTLTTGRFAIESRDRRKACWETTAQDSNLTVTVTGSIEFDGFTWFAVTLSDASDRSNQSGTAAAVDWVALEMPLRRECATLRTIAGRDLPTQYGGYWFGNEKAGLQYHWQSNQGWVLAGESGRIDETNGEVVLTIPFIQKRVDLSKPRTVSLGWAITPSKPIRKDWREVYLYRGVSYAYADHAGASPNYAVPHEKQETYDLWRYRLEQETMLWPITCYYAFGPFMWNGSPEYADWCWEWSQGSAPLPPDPNSKFWGGAGCHNSSAVNLQLFLLEKYLAGYPQEGIYFDCMGPSLCSNEAHGCGYVDDAGARQPEQQLLADRRYYERIYNLIKAHNPRTGGWVRHHDWSPNMVSAAFCDDNWLGEGACGAIVADPKHNYYDLVTLPGMRLQYGKEHWGHLTSWLTEMGVYVGNDPEARADVYGKMVKPPKDGEPGEWILPKWKDYEHVAGLAIVHDLPQVGGNSLDVPWWKVQEVERLMGWDDHVEFTGYWESGDRLTVQGGVPEKIVCALYRRPASAPPATFVTNCAAYNPWGTTYGVFYTKDGCRAKLRAAGANKNGWLILAPMNNTDEDVTLTLKPDLPAFGLEALANGRLRDIYRDYEGDWKKDDMRLQFQPEGESFPMTTGVAVVPVAKRNFRMLLLEPR